jgi:hypothetical protein
LTGGIGGGISGALPVAEGVAATSLAPTVANASALTAANSMTPTLANAAALESTKAAAANQAVNGAMSSALPYTGNLGNVSNLGISGLANNVIPAAAPSALAPVASAAAPIASATTPAVPQTFMEGMGKFAADPLASIKANPFTAGASSLAGAIGAKKKLDLPGEYDGPLKRFRFNPDTYQAAYAEGGITSLASGGYDQMVGEEPYPTGMADGGIANLGSYSDGGRMLRGPGDGMSDSIPASISGKRPARLADGEFVVPADVVSHLGNGSTDAGAKTLYAMMNKVRQARTGRKAQGREINPNKYVPA